MDLENFEFRPLTKGLGFDKTTETGEIRPQSRAVPVTNPEVDVLQKAQFEMPEKEFQLPNEAPVSRSLKKMLDSLPPSVDFTEDKKRETRMKGPDLPLREVVTPVYRPVQETPVAAVPATGFDVTLNNSLSQAFPKADVNKKFYHQMVTPIPQFKEIPMSAASAIIDFAVVLGLASLFVVTLVAITQVDLIRMLTTSQLSQKTMLELGTLYVGVTLFYFMLSRGLFGSTLGDWAFDVQLGTASERNHIMYPFQVLFRTFVIILTGIIVVPVVSLGFGKDIAYYFSGLKLMSRQY